jgi:hypothetical protein
MDLWCHKLLDALEQEHRFTAGRRRNKMKSKAKFCLAFVALTFVAGSATVDATTPQAAYSHTSGPPPGDGFTWGDSGPDFQLHELPDGEMFVTPDLGMTYGNFTHWPTVFDVAYVDLAQSGHIFAESWWGTASLPNPEVNLGFTNTPTGGIHALSFDFVWALTLQPAPDRLLLRVSDYIGPPGGARREATLEVNLPDVFVSNEFFHGRAGRVELDVANLFDDESAEPFEQIEDVWIELDSIAETFGPHASTFAMDNVIINNAPFLTGDYNHNSTVDAADYVLWRKNDPTLAGYDTWRAHFGQTAGSGSSHEFIARPDSVPEPASWLLVAIACSACRSRRRNSFPTR